MSTDKNNDKEITLKELLLTAKEWINYLLSYFKIIFLCGILGAILGICYSFYKKPLYTATLTFALEDEKANSSLGSSLATQFGFDLGGSSGGGMFTGTNLIELLKSRKMTECALMSPVENNPKMSLAELFIKENKFREAWDENPRFKKIQFLPNADRKKFTRDQDSILGLIYQSVTNDKMFSVAQKEKKVALIIIEYKSEQERFAKLYTESLAKVVSQFYTEVKSKKARTNLAILMKQSDSVRAELNGAITGVAVANDNTFGLNPALNIKRTPSAKRQVDVQSNSAVLSELIKQTELAKITVRKETPLIQIIDRPIYPLEVKKFGKLKGLIFGGFFAGFCALFFFVLKKFYNDLMS